MTAEQRNDRRRGFLDRTSAEERAQFTAYMDAINDRREERGLEPMRGRLGDVEQVLTSCQVSTFSPIDQMRTSVVFLIHLPVANDATTRTAW